MLGWLLASDIYSKKKFYFCLMTGLYIGLQVYTSQDGLPPKCAGGACNFIRSEDH